MLGQDLRFAVRMAGREPGFTALAVLTLALGIAVNASIFTLVNAVFLRPLAVPQPDRIAALYHRSGDTLSSTSYPDFAGYRAAARSFSSLAAYVRVPAYVRIHEATERLSVELVSEDFFKVLNIRPAAGRFFGAEQEAAAVVSHRLWQERLGGMPDAIGRRVRIGNGEFTIAGVAPPEFRGLVMDWGDPPEIWLPLAQVRAAAPAFREDPLAMRGQHWLLVAGRLRPGVSIAQAQAEIGGVNAAIRQLRPAGMRNFEPVLMPISEARFWPGYRERIARYLATLAAVVALVLLIACANAANLLLMRTLRRTREVALRVALGAGRGRLLRQFLTEGLLLAALGGAAGLLLSSWATALVLRAYPKPFNIALALDPGFDWRIGAFTAALSMLTGILVGLAPLRHAGRAALATTLKADVPRKFGIADTLIAVQVALALVLLAGASLFLRTLRNAQQVDVTVAPERVLLVEMDTLGRGLPVEREQMFQRELLERVRTMPRVQSASLAMVVPLGGRRGGTNVSADTSSPSVQVNFNVVSAGYFQTIGIPVVAGRDFASADGAGAPSVAVVNEVFARRFWPGGQAVGRTFLREGSERIEVIGVVRDGRMRNYREDPRPCFYLPLTQKRAATTLQVRASGDPLDLVPAIRREIAALDPDVPVTVAGTMRAYVDAALSQERMASALVSCLGLLALGLASVGLYGVVGAAVARRTREIGVRMAIGAEPGQVVAMALRRALAPVALGVAAGVPLALALARGVRTLLFGVEPADPLSFGLAIGLLSLVAALAAWLPARRAAKVDPILALRYE